MPIIIQSRHLANDVAASDGRAPERTKLPPDKAPSALTKKQADNKGMIWRPKWNDAAVGVSFKYGDDGTLELPIYKTYGADGKIRVHYRGESADGSSKAAPASANSNKAGGASPVKSPASADNAGMSSNKEAANGCGTCSSREYKDGSNDMGVSFKSPGHISPEASVAKVMSHESEHEGRAQRDGEDAQVYTQKRIHMAQCPECNRMYAAGGETQVIKLEKKDGKFDITA